MCQHIWTCRHMLICVDIHENINHFQHTSFQPFETYLAAGICQHIWHADMCWYVPTCAEMCWHVPTCDINQATSYSDHLDLIYVLACVSTCGHADMCWYVPTCADMWHTSDTNHLKPILTDMCQKIGTCRLICAGMCWHVPTCDINLDTSYSDHLDLI